MSIRMRQLITLTCLIAALAAYIIGWGQGVTGFVVIGIFLEGTFWFRLLWKKKLPPPIELGH